MNFKAINPKGTGAEHLRSRPCDATQHDGSGDGDSAARGCPTATPQEARVIVSLERWLESVKAGARARERPHKVSQSPTRRKLKTTSRRQVDEPVTTLRNAPPTMASRQEAALPPDGWVRIVSDLNISASNVEMWLRVDRHSGYIEEFRIGPRPVKS